MLAVVNGFYQTVGVKSKVGDSIEFEYRGKVREGKIHMVRFDTWHKTTLVTIRENDGHKSYYVHNMKDFRNITLDNLELAS